MAKVFLHEQSSSILNNDKSRARLTVYCPADSIVTVSKGDIVYTETSSTDISSQAKAVFSNLTHGLWTVVISNGSQTATETVEIVTDYETSITFFGSSITVTYPVGSVCTISNSDETFSAPDTTGSWTCVLPNVGTWTVSCTDGENIKTKEVTITKNEQHETVSIAYFMATINATYPNGAVCSCTNGSITYSASDTTGAWTFTVFKDGIWTVKATDGIQTVTEDVNIVGDLQNENVEIRFFASTIDITYPEGAECTVSDGITTFKAQDTIGSWSVSVPRTGVWTITASSGSKKVTKSVEVTYDGQSLSVTCKFFASYINVTYPSGTLKLVLWYVDDYGIKQEIVADTSDSGTCKFIVAQVGTYKVGAYRVDPYVGIETSIGDYSEADAIISEDEQTVSIELTYNTIPEFTYTGTYKITDDSGNNITESKSDWIICLLTSGALTFSKLNGAKNGIDVFVLGGGGNGGLPSSLSVGGYTYYAGGGGGGGGYRENITGLKINTDTAYDITVGGAGGRTSAFGVNANGGGDGGSPSGFTSEDSGGSGGSGGSSGGRGGVNAAKGTDGEDGSYAFSEISGTRYGPGGGGGYGHNGATGMTGTASYGGKDGGGNSNTNATPNSGGGGGGGSQTAYTWSDRGSGAAGVVMIRNKR